VILYEIVGQDQYQVEIDTDLITSNEEQKKAFGLAMQAAIESNYCIESKKDKKGDIYAVTFAGKLSKAGDLYAQILSILN